MKPRGRTRLIMVEDKRETNMCMVEAKLEAKGLGGRLGENW